jgi:hypothetical protein
MTANANVGFPVPSGARGFDELAGQLFPAASQRRGLALAGWALALGAHVGLALFFAHRPAQTAVAHEPPPVDVEFVNPPEPPPPLPEPVAPADAKAPAVNAAPATPAAARAGALHLAKSDAAPAQQTEEAVDFTTDPNGTTYGGGVVAVGGTAAFGAAGARVGSLGGNAPQALIVAKPVADALVPASDLSRKPQLPGSDPCRGFFPTTAQNDVGDVAVIVTINKAGHVTNTQLLSETPSRQGFGIAARTCLANQRFTPALDRAGNSAATAIRVNLRFSR